MASGSGHRARYMTGQASDGQSLSRRLTDFGEARVRCPAGTDSLGGRHFAGIATFDVALCIPLMY
ncbi:hypothetical protein C7U60_14120 [Mesorhizobium plurifarium]|nr:hypothetical protein C7U60_14120 [Mesorhizobium plurifarium]